jgi:hypothetical protein
MGWGAKKSIAYTLITGLVEADPTAEAGGGTDRGCEAASG